MSEQRDLRADLEGLQKNQSEWSELPKKIIIEYIERAIKAEEELGKAFEMIMVMNAEGCDEHQQAAALREENDRLQRCYDITNQSWKDLLAKIERLEAVAEAAREVEKFIFPIKGENLVKVIGSDINKLVQALAALDAHE